MTRRKFAELFLDGIKAPKTRRNLAACLAVMQAEGNSARCNPFNTTRKTADSWTLHGNTASVQEYPDFATGIKASVMTMVLGAEMVGDPYGYAPLLQSFKDNNGAMRTLLLWEDSAWGTGRLALACLPQTYVFFRHYSNVKILGSKV